VKSEAVATSNEMPVILVNKVVDKKRIIEKRKVDEKERHMGSLTKKIQVGGGFKEKNKFG
jgi:hypothetical protein